MTPNFSAPLSTYFTLSNKKLALFEKAGVQTLGELLLHLPLRYEDRSHLTPIADLKHDAYALVHAEVVDSRVSFGRRKMLHVTVEDNSGARLYLRYFHFFASQPKQFVAGRWGLFYAKAQAGAYGMEFHHPEIQWLNGAQLPELSEHLLAVYSTVSGLSQKDWRKLVAQALALVKPLAVKDVLVVRGYLSFYQALEQLHRPQYSLDEAQLTKARERLIVEELCAHQLSIALARAYRSRLQAPKIRIDAQALQRFEQSLTFELTQAQRRVFAEITQDLTRSQPMMRLIQGDVGSGKTIVALLAALAVIYAGYQAVLMVPTELLAEQHAQNIQRLLQGQSIQVAVLVSKMPAAKKRATLQAVTSGEVQLIIGTHAVFQAQVQYHNLALIMIDEQHRFGVHQRLALQDKSVAEQAVHQLVLTATPIPRTLAMSVYGELDVSVIDELPAGRKPIHTSVISASRREALIERVGENCRQGRQAYWVCPLIEESEVLECENAQAIAQMLQACLPDIKVGLVHGRLAQQERYAVMQAFIKNEIALLVATTVIEVGVDVANASLMIIENAERFGLAQLHQLRGRVGRGAQQSYCVLMYQAPLGEVARQRLEVMRESNDGFVIAQEDLNIRGGGELLGTRQTGAKLFKVADLERDAMLLPKIAQYTQEWLMENQAFVEILLARWTAGKMRYLQS